MYIAYANTTGGTTLSQRSSSIHWQPYINKIQGFQVVPEAPVDVPALVNQTFIVSFTRPMTDTSGSRANPISLTEPTKFVFAFNKNQAPNSPDSTSSSFHMHTDKGSFTLNLSSSANATSVDDHASKNATSVEKEVASFHEMNFAATPVDHEVTSFDDTLARTAPVHHVSDIISDSFCTHTDVCVYAQRNTTSNMVTFTLQSSVKGMLKSF